MATGKRRATYFTNLELEILMRSYGEFQQVFRKKCNTAAAAKERETAWESIAARVNACVSINVVLCNHNSITGENYLNGSLFINFLFRCNPAGEKRTWQQLKMKYKNIVQTGKTSARMYLILITFYTVK